MPGLSRRFESGILGICSSKCVLIPHLLHVFGNVCGGNWLICSILIICWYFGMSFVLYLV